MLLTEKDGERAFDRCWQADRAGRTFLADITDWQQGARENAANLGGGRTIAAIAGRRGARIFTSNNPGLLEDVARARDSRGRLALGEVMRRARRLAKNSIDAVDVEHQYDPALLATAKLEEKAYIEKMRVYDVVPRGEAARDRCRVIKTRWVIADKGSEDRPALRAR